MLTPVDIHNKEFTTSFRGFNKEDVDDFLDQVVNDYETLYRENRQLKKEIELNKKQLDQYHQLEKNLQDTLLVAQRTADEVVTTANTRGEEIRQAAKQAGENLKREAQLYADKLRQEAEQDCKRKIDHAATQVRAAVEEYDRLVRERRQFVAKMRNLMQTELGLLEEAYDICLTRWRILLSRLRQSLTLTRLMMKICILKLSRIETMMKSCRLIIICRRNQYLRLRLRHRQIRIIRKISNLNKYGGCGRCH